MKNKIDYRKLYCRLYRYLESNAQNKRFDIYWDRYGSSITEKMCKNYIENIIRDKPIGGWEEVEKQKLGFSFESPEQLEINLTMRGY